MYIWNVLVLLFTQLGDMGSPSQYLIPLTILAGAVIQLLLMRRYAGRKRWALLWSCGGAVLLMELLLWVIHSYTALLFIIVMTYAMAALVGGLAGVVLCMIFREN